MDDNDVPIQPAEGPTLSLYFHLRLLYILGFLEALLGVGIMVIELTAIALFYHPDLSVPIEIAGIFLGLLVLAAGILAFLSGKRDLKAEKRHRFFLVAFVLSLITALALIGMFIICVLRTHYLYEDVADKSRRFNSEEFRQQPYLFSLEGTLHMAHLRALASAVYCLSLLLFLITTVLLAVNLRRNRANVQSNGVYQPVEKNEKAAASSATAVIYNNQKQPISSKLDLPWIDQS